jgi:hypothetical protein
VISFGGGLMGYNESYVSVKTVVSLVHRVGSNSRNSGEGLNILAYSAVLEFAAE